MALEPITRQEKIIAGQDLTPITRLEMFLKNFGGGGGSVPKPLTYDYMPAGYPKKSVETITVLEEQELAFADEGGLYVVHIKGSFEITEGRTYTVNWDGTDYECVGSVFNEIPILGNTFIYGVGQDTGEPFLYMFEMNNYGSFLTSDTAASHTISVKTAEETVTPMAPEFLPAGGGGADDVYTVKQITNYGTGEKELQGDYAGAMAAYQSGKKLKFVDAFNSGGQEVVNAESFSYTFGQSGKIIFVTYQNYNFVTYELTESGVTGRSDTYIKALHVDAARSFFLKSGSNKQFRVIVSDTGELSTEEVT